jgi:hypothetical protein
MKLLSKTGSSEGSVFVWILLAAFLYFLLEHQMHYFDAPSLKGYKLGMSLKEFKDAENPAQSLNYTEMPGNVLVVSTSDWLTLAGDNAIIGWVFDEADRSKPFLCGVTANLTPSDGGAKLFSQLASKYGNVEKTPSKSENGFSGFKAQWKPFFGRYTVKIEGYSAYVNLTIYKTSDHDMVERQGKEPASDI